MTSKQTEALINMSTHEVSFKKSEYAVVVFPHMPETFPTDAHIECRYTITQDYVPTTRDWVGLYKVGWISFNDYLYYEWVAPPKNNDGDAEGNILFPSHKMPEDDGDFYQFCYVASSGQVKGASTPFQFKRPRADDFVEMIDDENDMLIIHSKTCLLEETIKKKEKETAELIQKLNEYDEKCSNLNLELAKTGDQLEEEQKMKEALCEELELAQKKISGLQHEFEDMILIQDELAVQVTQLTQEKMETEKKVEVLETEKIELTEKVKFLQNQKDETLGKNKILQEENEMFKTQLSSREKSVFETQKMTETLRTAIAEVSGEIQVYEQKNNVLSKKLEKEKKLSLTKKDEVARLSEKLRNSEDKLCAAESTKQMLQKELSAYEVTLKKMSSDLEASKGEFLSLKVQFHKTVAEHQENKKMLEETIKEFKKENKSLEKEASNCVPAQSIYYLQEAQETLRQRLTNTTKQNSELSAQKEDLTKKLAAVNVQNQELLEERKEWQLRLSKCSEEYKKIYAENKKNLRKVSKLKNSTSATVSDSSETFPDVSEGSGPSVCEASKTEKLEQEMQRDQSKEEQKHKNKVRLSSAPKLATANGHRFNQPEKIILEQPTLLYGNPYAGAAAVSESKPGTSGKYPYPLPKTLAPKSFDSDNLSGYPNQKLLPRPIEPTVLPSAKAAALKAVFSPSCEKSSSDAHVRFFDSHDVAIPDMTVNTDGEQFFEAVGEEMRICPRCNDSFGLDMSESDFSEHIASHFGRVCPVCKKITDDEMTQEMFEHHVNMCLKPECPEQ